MLEKVQLIRRASWVLSGALLRPISLDIRPKQTGRKLGLSQDSLEEACKLVVYSGGIWVSCCFQHNSVKMNPLRFLFSTWVESCQTDGGVRRQVFVRVSWDHEYLNLSGNQVHKSKMQLQCQSDPMSDNPLFSYRFIVLCCLVFLYCSSRWHVGLCYVEAVEAKMKREEVLMAGNQAAMCDLVHSRIWQTEVWESLLHHRRRVTIRIWIWSYSFLTSCHPTTSCSVEKVQGDGFVKVCFKTRSLGGCMMIPKLNCAYTHMSFSDGRVVLSHQL